MVQPILHLQFKIFRMKKIIVIVLTTIFGSSINAQIIPFGFKKPTVLIAGQSYGGGKVAYILVPGDPGYSAGETHGLIAATSDQNNGSSVSWSVNGTNITTGATGTAIGTGLFNTTKITSIQGAGSYAAKFCEDYTVTVGPVTYDDWYLPSIDELNKLYLNKVAIGGFAGDYYWSSTEVNLSDEMEMGWGQNFNSGSQFRIAKEGLSYVRAIRAF
jgi:hypothetical protein